MSVIFIQKIRGDYCVNDSSNIVMSFVYDNFLVVKILSPEIKGDKIENTLMYACWRIYFRIKLALIWIFVFAGLV